MAKTVCKRKKRDYELIGHFRHQNRASIRLKRCRPIPKYDSQFRCQRLSGFYHLVMESEVLPQKVEILNHEKWLHGPVILLQGSRRCLNAAISVLVMFWSARGCQATIL